MLRKLLLLLTVSVLNAGFSQHSVFLPSDSLNKKRLITTSVTIGTIWTGSMVGLSQVWYKNVEKSKFHVFDDCSNWLQMDKVGHTYTSNKISIMTGDMFKWSGIKPKKAAIFGSLIGFGYQSTFEMFDAYSKDWGFSWCDMGANLLGSGIYLAQELALKDQYFQLKFSYHPTEFAIERPEILGSTYIESLFKDYNGQTYWITFNPLRFTKSTFPKWICLSFGYSADEKLVGDAETFNSVLTPGKTYNSHREWLLSLDVDFSKIPAKRPWCKALLKQLNYIKVPFPALILINGKLKASPLYF